MPAALGPVPHRALVDGDHGGHEGPLVAEGDRFADERAELELVLDELRRERRAVGEGADVLGPIDDDEVAARIDEPRVTGVEPAVRIDDLARGLLVLQVALEDAGPRTSTSPRSAILTSMPGHGPAGGRRDWPRARLQRHQAGRLRRAVDLLEVDADRAEEAEGVGSERRPAGQRPLGLPQTQLIADRPVDEELAERAWPAAGAAEPACRRRAGSPPARPPRGSSRRSARLSGGRVGGPHLDGGEHVFPDAGRGEDASGPSSRRSRCTVSGLSGQLAQKPTTRLAKSV